MKDSTKNNDPAAGQNKGQDWDDPAFGWENMQAGIFEKIEAADPDFFQEKRRRRLPIWFWFLVAVVLAGGGITAYFQKGMKSSGTMPTATKQQVFSPEIKPQNEPATAPKTVTETPLNNSEHQTTTAQDFTKRPTRKSAERKSNRPPTKQQSIASISTNRPDQPVLKNGEMPNTSAVAAPDEPKGILASDNPIAENTNPAQIPVLGIRPFLMVPSVPMLAEQPITPSKPPTAKGKWSLTAMGGGLLSTTPYTGSSPAVALRNAHSSPWFGYQYGLNLEVPVGKKAGIFVGASRQVAYQNIDIYTERQIQVKQENVLLSVTHNIVAGSSTPTYGDTTVNAVEKNRLVNYNELKTVQGQLGFTWRITSKNWHFSPFAGAAVGYVTGMEGFTVAADKSILAFGKASPILRNFQFAPLAGVQVERDLGKALALGLRYQFQQQINNTSRETDMSYKPATSFLSLGLTMRLGGK